MSNVPRYIKDLPLARKASEEAQRRRRAELAQQQSKPLQPAGKQDPKPKRTP